jgi:hypothetical protein
MERKFNQYASTFVEERKGYLGEHRQAQQLDQSSWRKFSEGGEKGNH